MSLDAESVSVFSFSRSQAQEGQDMNLTRQLQVPEQASCADFTQYSMSDEFDLWDSWQTYHTNYFYNRQLPRQDSQIIHGKMVGYLEFNEIWLQADHSWKLEVCAPETIR